MMTNLFSIFDPSTSTMFSFNWLTPLLCLLLLPMNFWLISSLPNTMWNMIMFSLYKEMSLIIKNLKNLNLMLSILLMILLINFFSLTPYIFTNTAHMCVSLSLSLPLWLSFMWYGWFNKPLNMFAHLVPQGTPPLLMPFMVIIETTSNIIRPITLAVRLSANMIAGHMLLTLMSSSNTQYTLLILIIILTQCLLMMLEMGVALIQAYVFSILSTLYCAESNYEMNFWS